MAGHGGRYSAWLSARLKSTPARNIAAELFAHKLNNLKLAPSILFDGKIDKYSKKAEKISVTSPQLPDGFRHLLGIGASGLFGKTKDGQDLVSADGFVSDAYKAAIYSLGEHINNATNIQNEDSTNADGVEEWENLRIPAGYTYLLQLIAHDLVDSSFSTGSMLGIKQRPENLRRSKLQLETVYGDGPESSPHLYWLNTAGKQRLKLSLGRMKPHANQNAEVCPFRDIARVSPVMEPTQETKQKTKPETFSEAVIGDQRNDDNAVLSQLLTFFHIAHNAIADLIAKVLPQHSLDDAVVFQFTRASLTLIYRNIIRHDVLRRILHPDVFEIYVQDGFRLTQPSTYTIPVEFTHGAFRFAHAMVRSGYQFNQGVYSKFSLTDVLKQTSALQPNSMPLSEIWIADWARFFPVYAPVLSEAKKRPLYSRKLFAPYTSKLLQNEMLNESIPSQSYASGGMFTIDLLSHACIHPISVKALIPAIKILAGSKGAVGVRLANLLTNDPLPALQASDLSIDPSAEAVKTFLGMIGNDIPLPIHVLMEAKIFGAEHLGQLGSIIIAETILGAMDADPLIDQSIEPLPMTDQLEMTANAIGLDTLSADLRTLFAEQLEDHDWNRPSSEGPALSKPIHKGPETEIVTMAQLIRFVDRIRPKDAIPFANQAQ